MRGSRWLGHGLARALAAAGMLGAQGAMAQCRVGSGPDMGDGVPYCADLEPPAPASPRPPAQWQDMFAAVAWGDGPDGDVYVGVGHYIDEQLATESVLAKCHEKGWRNCEVASTVANGVIVVARDSKGRLRLRSGGEEAETRRGLLAKCAAEGETCKILKVYDGRARYF